MPEYKLTYFNVKALGEPIRFLLSYANIDFEDNRFEREQWPSIKPNTPFGQVPMLEIGGKKYAQSMAICRFIAKKINLAGKDEWEALEIDSMVDLVNDWRLKMAPGFYEPDEKVKEEKYQQIAKEVIPFYIEKFEAIAKENGGYLACKKMTWADFVLAGMIDYLNLIARMDLTAKSPNLKKVVDNVNSLPAIKAWIAKRPTTTM